MVAAVRADRIVDERVLDVHQNRGGGIDLADLLDADRDHHQRTAGAAVFLGDFDPHEAHLEELVDQRAVEFSLALHLLHARADFVVRESGDGVAKCRFVVGEDRQRCVREGHRHEVESAYVECSSGTLAVARAAHAAPHEPTRPFGSQHRQASAAATVCATSTPARSAISSASFSCTPNASVTR